MPAKPEEKGSKPMLSHTLILSVAALIGLAIVAATALTGWNAWLALRSRELEHAGRPGAGPSAGEGSIHAVCTHTLARIEIADLRERIRKLEDIAAGIDV